MLCTLLFSNWQQVFFPHTDLSRIVVYFGRKYIGASTFEETSSRSNNTIFKFSSQFLIQSSLNIQQKQSQSAASFCSNFIVTALCKIKNHLRMDTATLVSYPSRSSLHWPLAICDIREKQSAVMHHATWTGWISRCLEHLAILIKVCTVHQIGNTIFGFGCIQLFVLVRILNNFFWPN